MANKRVIDLAELSQTVQEGQYILADSAGGTGKMDLKRILDDNKTEIDDTLSISGYAADAKAVGGALDAVNGTLATKADADGTYVDMAVGDVVSDKKIVDAVPYLFRPSASVGERAYETIVGASVGENQLYGKTGNSTNKGITFTNVDGKITISGENDGTGTSYYIYNFAISIPANHVIAFRSGVNGGSATTYDAQLIADGGSNEISYDGKSYIVTKKNYPWTGCNLNVRTGYNADQNPVTFAPEIIDLTTELGSTIADYIYQLESATAGSGIAKLREWGFCTGYEPYNAGTIESVEVTDKVVRGFNQWDEVCELGAIGADGVPYASNTSIRSKNFIPVVGGATYYYRNGSGINQNPWLYDANQNFISRLGSYVVNGTFTVPSGCSFIKIALPATYGTAYNNDICINLSSDRNGEYEAYVSHTYDLGSDVLRGIFKLDANNQLYADGDVKTADGTITRRYSELLVDGSFNVRQVNLHSTTGLYYTIITNTLNAPVSNPIPLSNRFIGVPSGIAVGNCYVTNNGASLVAVLPDQSITTVDGATQWFAQNPTKFIYELATPTTEQSTPFTSPQTVYPDGTEEFVTTNSVPVGHSTDYPYSIKALAEELIDIPDVPTANGTYVLKATRSASGITYAWVAG